MVDIDNLKVINDSDGHLEGDKVIIDVCNTISKYGIVIRSGGDEFLVLSKTKKDFFALNEIKSCYFSSGGALKTEYKHIKDGIKLADERLYLNKQQKGIKTANLECNKL